MSFFYHNIDRISVLSASEDCCGFVYSLIMIMIFSFRHLHKIGACHS